MNITYSTRQHRLYTAKGFDLKRYTELVEDANQLRSEIKAVASEYDVDWDEREELKKAGIGEGKQEVIKEELKEERKKHKNKEEQEDDDDGDNDGKKSGDKKKDD